MSRSVSQQYLTGSVRPSRLWLKTTVFAVAALFCHWFPAGAQAASVTKGKTVSIQSSLLQTDFPYTTTCLGASFPTNNTAYKGIAVRLGNDAYMCFDTDLLRVSAGWTGSYITTHGVAFDGAHGAHPMIAGEQKFGTAQVPAWDGVTARFEDKRSEPYGPARNMGRWDGLYTVGDKVVLSYTVLGTKVFEQPGSALVNGETAFTRTFEIGKVRDWLSMLVCDVEGGSGRVEGNAAYITGANNTVTAVGIVGLPASKGWLEVVNNSRVVLKLAKGASIGTFQLVIWQGATADQAKFLGFLGGLPTMVDFRHGGPAHWPEPVVTKGVVAANTTPDGSYAVDQLTPPIDNPWKRRVRIGGFDFFSDGKRAAVSTWDGDIWIVSGIDDKLDKLTWKRFASGGYETLGLKIVNDVIYTSGRNQITRYYDLNNDGEADYYENFNDDITSSTGFHEFVFDLQTDRKGNFYFAKAGPVRGGGRGFGGGGGNGVITEHAGTLLKLSKDGKKLEVYATGLRAPNGISVSPEGQVTSGDNEGTWVPECPLNFIHQGGYYGVKDTAHSPTGEVPKRDLPLMWFNHANWDNSSGGQVWVTSKQWGPFQGELLHLSYGQCALYLIMKETVKGQIQGGAVRLPITFSSTAMRGRFNDHDGQLYVTGLQGWQTKATKITGFDRIRYTGKPVHTAAKLKVLKDGVQLTFTQPLDRAAATDVENYSAQRWNLQIHYVDDKISDGRIIRPADIKELNYGGLEVSTSDPLKLGRESEAVQKATLSPDGLTLTLQLADFKPVDQLLIKYLLKAKDGTEVKQEVLETIHNLP